MVVSADSSRSNEVIYRTPILRKRWYEIGVLSVRAFTKLPNSSFDKSNDTLKDNNTIDKDMCMKLNKDKSILDSGTTSIRLPDEIFTKVGSCNVYYNLRH